MKRDAIDLGTAGVFTLFRKYFVPTLFGMLSMSAVTAIDGIFVGHGIGSDGIAAINICIPLLMLFTGVGLMIGAGASVVASIHLSHGKPITARLHVTQAILFVTIVALIPSVLMMAYPSATAHLLGASEHLTPMVREYLLWFVPQLTFQMWCSVCLFVIRLDGSPRLAMMCNVTAAIVSVLLGWLFIFPFGWGLMGAAFAATIGLFVGGAMGLVYLSRFADKLRFFPVKWSVKSLRLSIRNIGYQCRIGSSALLTEATLATLMFVGNHVFMTYLGDNGVGAFGIACYYIPFVFMVGNAIAQSAQPIISYNFGLGYRERVVSTERIAQLTSVVCGVIIMTAFSLFPQLLVGLFINPDNAAARIAIEGYPYFSTAFIFFILNLTVIGYYQSVEQVKPAIALALLRGFIFLIPSFLLLPKMIGINGIWLALCLSEFLTTICILVGFIVKTTKGKLHVRMNAIGNK
jgi:Na+-driven multidrug efflux pump